MCVWFRWGDTFQSDFQDFFSSKLSAPTRGRVNNSGGEWQLCLAIGLPYDSHTHTHTHGVNTLFPGESDPYTASSEGPGDDSLGTYGDYGRVGMAAPYTPKYVPNPKRTTIPWIYRSACNDDGYYGGWDE